MSKIEPILDKFCCLTLYQKNLRKMRDSLLPKLISGELRISDAEKLIEEIRI